MISVAADSTIINCFIEIERFPSRPYIMDGYPKNTTVLVNDTAFFSCPPVSDLSPYLVWYAMKVENDTDIKSLPSELQLEVS